MKYLSTFFMFLYIVVNPALADEILSFEKIEPGDKALTEDEKLGGNGTWVPGDANNFNSVIYLNQKGCTASLIGESTILTAAHCLNGKNGRISYTRKIKKDDDIIEKPIIYSCEVHSEYKNDDSNDYALCKAEQTGLRYADNIIYDSIVTDKSLLKRKNHLLLTGYGCQVTPTEDYTYEYRIGKASIEYLPSSSSNFIYVSREILNNSEVISDGAVLCPGDSGGPSYYLKDSNSIVGRKVIGVNAKTDTVCIYKRLSNGVCSDQDRRTECKNCWTLGDTSYLSSTTTDKFIAFIKKWANDNAQKICGWDKFTGNNNIICR